MTSIPLHIYAVRAIRTPFVKVGITGNLAERIKRMRTETPHALRFIVHAPCDQASDLEHWAHRQLEHRHVRGEWFWVYRDKSIIKLFSRGLALVDQGMIPPKPSPGIAHPERTRAFVIERLLSCGWDTEDFRREQIFRGDNNKISNEVEAARKRLGIESGDHRTPIAGRPTSAQFADPALNYQPPPGGRG